MPPPLHAEVLLRRRFEPITCTYTTRDTILYALGVGVGVDDTLSDATLRYTYEDGLSALPTQATVLGWTPEAWSEDPPTGIDWTGALHAEQTLRMHRPMPASATLVAQERIAAVYDKGADKGALMVTERTLRDARDDALVATLTTTAMLRRNGGFGGDPNAPRPHPMPERPADAVLALPTRPDQALIYRLSGDYNPLHAHPAAARHAGFDRPILHGLCTYGVAGRAVLQLLCGDDAARLQRFDVRFVRPVFPGETLITEVWRITDARAAVRVRVKERDVVVLDHGLAEYAP